MQSETCLTSSKLWKTTMSEILIGTNPKNPQIVGVVDLAAQAEEKARQLPKPAGFHILCALPEANKEFDSGIAKSDETLRYEELLTTVLFVVDLGPDCYMDKAKFPSGPRCKKGDFVLVRPNSGSRLEIHGREFRLIYDDTVEATVEDPRGIRRK